MVSVTWCRLRVLLWDRGDSSALYIPMILQEHGCRCRNSQPPSTVNSAQGPNTSCSPLEPSSNAKVPYRPYPQAGKPQIMPTYRLCPAAYTPATPKLKRENPKLKARSQLCQALHHPKRWALSSGPKFILHLALDRSQRDPKRKRKKQRLQGGDNKTNKLQR